MKCVVCKSEMPQRNGKFGTFYFCKLGHGTASVQGTKLFVTGAIFTKMAESREEIEGMEMEMPDLEFAVRRGMASIGFFMSDLYLFIEGGREAAQDEEDHWMNGRLY